MALEVPESGFFIASQHESVPYPLTIFLSFPLLVPRNESF